LPTLSQQLSALLKPLRQEIKGGLANRAVSKGLDRYVMLRCEDLARRLPPSEKELGEFLLRLRSDFSQYMTLDTGERQGLVVKAGVELKAWAEKLTQRPDPVLRTAPGRLSLSDPILPLVPKEKAKAFHLTKLKTVDDLLHYAPKWALDKSLLTPIGRCEGREEPTFLLGRINGISQTRRGRLETTKVVLEDGAGFLTWTWYNRPYLKKELWNGRWVILHENPQVSKWGKQVVGRAETYEFLSQEDAAALEAGKAVVFYPSTPGFLAEIGRSGVGRVLEGPAAGVLGAPSARIPGGVRGRQEEVGP